MRTNIQTANYHCSVGCPHETCVVMESTGNYHLPVAWLLNASGFYVSVVSAALAHDYGNNLRRAKIYSGKRYLIDLHKSVSASIQRRQKLQAKRITLGHKPDNHEGKQMQGGMVMDGVHSSLPLRNTNPYGFWSGVFFGKRRRRLCRFTPFHFTGPSLIFGPV